MDNLSDIPHHPEQILHCGDVQIASDSFGDPIHPPVLLIMGLSTQMIHWPESFCRALAARGLWVIRMDNRDMGKSTLLRQHRPPTFHQLLAHKWFKKSIVVPYRLEDMARDCIGLLDQLNISQAHLVGVSMGGMIAQLIAIQFPSRALSLTNIMTTTGEKRLMQPSARVLWQMAKKPGKTRASHLAHSMQLWEILHSKHLPFPTKRIEQTIQLAWQRGFSASGVLRQLAAIVTASDRTEALKQLTLPSLIIHGEQDPMLKVANAHALSRALPHAQKILLPKMGHTLPEEYWTEIISAIAALAD